MSNFQHKNHGFSTSDLLTLFALVAVVATVSGMVLASGMQDQRPERAKSSAEAYAFQLLEQQNRRTLRPGLLTGGSDSRGKTQGVSDQASVNAEPSSESGRAPGSEVQELRSIQGEIGRDPWGQPFHYRVQELPLLGRRRVVVWSDGPNRKAESEQLVAKLTGVDQQPTFGGDDIGYVREEVVRR